MGKKITYLLAVALFCLPFLGFAQTVFEADEEGASRTSIDLYGGYVHDLEVGPDSTAYVGFNSPNGFFFTTDLGTTWNSLPVGTDMGNIANIETSADGVYVIGGINLYRSTDGCASFETLSPVDVGSALHYGQDKVFVGLRSGLLGISSDGGDNFDEVIVDDSVTSIQYITTSATTDDVYVLAYVADNTLALFYSVDGGTTWADSGISFTATTHAAEITVKPTDANFIILTGGDTTQYTTTGVTGTWATLEGGYSGSVVFNGDRIYVGNHYTDNNGVDWTAMADITSGDKRVKSESIAMDPNNTDVFYIETMIGVGVSSDNGTTWLDANTGLKGITVSDFSQSTDKNTVWLACYGGLAKSVNFTEDDAVWEFPIVADSSIDYSTAVWMDPDDNDIVVADMNTKIYYSTDAGDTWTEGADLSTEYVKDFLEVDDVLYAATGSGVLKSEDLGATWTDFGLTDIPVNSLAVDYDGHIFAGVGEEFDDNSTTRKGVYKYDGDSWTQLEGAIEGYLINDIMAVNESVYAAAGETGAGGVFRSTDDGATWEDLTANGLAADGWYHALAFEAANSDILYVSTARPAGTGYIYKSMDAGDTWSLLYTGLKDETFNVLIFDGLVSGSNTGLYNMRSKVKLSLKSNSYRVARGGYVSLSSKLKDAATNNALVDKPVRLYKKYKTNGHWRFVKNVGTNDLGKILISRKITKKTFFQVRWHARTSVMRESYGAQNYHSRTIKVKVQ